ncbi:MAG: hypothetical protein JWM68_4975, partial [Verrucomicrobiales bacterium]|nr:hypothetical protein [Verrucomicrobiales bacterium]
QGIGGYSYKLITGYTYSQILSYTVTKSTPTATNIIGEKYDFILTAPGDYYVNGDLYGSVLVNGSGTARLYVTGNVSFSGKDDGITIKTGANLQLFVGGPNTKLAGKGIVNDGGTAESFKYFGLPTNTDIDMHGNFAFTGQLYAPSANLSVGGGGNDDYDFVGAAVVASAKLNGHANFHYDEALSKSGLGTGFMIGSWTEEY